MSEWWTYALSDLLMFSQQTYFRLFALHNAALWPAQVPVLILGLILLACLWHGGARAGRAVAVLLALAWLAVAWAYFGVRYTTINLAAPSFAIGFVLQAVLLLWLASRRRPPVLAQPSALPGRFAFGLACGALLAFPLLAPLGGRPWTQAELFGLAPDPTVAFTFGALLLWRAAWPLWVLPLLWCAITGATLMELGSAQAWLLPAIGLAALGLRLLVKAQDARPRR